MRLARGETGSLRTGISRKDASSAFVNAGVSVCRRSRGLCKNCAIGIRIHFDGLNGRLGEFRTVAKDQVVIRILQFADRAEIAPVLIGLDNTLRRNGLKMCANKKMPRRI